MVSSEHTIPDSSALTDWYKSSFSGGGQGECLEVARGYGDVPVRDSKAVTGPVVVFPAEAWSSFVSGVKGGFFPG
ncbi:DUF397 domain-containing protein [Streptomyces sp. H27-C3]|uniref:DUF397 domain-containing protein n=1 Tax=Streptomyces sp. H27-C3 TaxID=3046305 RepID=UPI0024B908FD|nr:DUF397 domain-containing protein [Streptomyces sp. H27-C3]MDJ0463679.1 DUF397 domain-containing protein [Streptomyces sp. H27-C3]